MDSYDLKSAAEHLGWEVGTLQDRLRDGAFPGRFLVRTSGGTEMRIPRVDLEREASQPRAVATTGPRAAVVVRDDHALVEELRALVATDRGEVLQKMEAAFRERDGQIEALRKVVEDLKSSIGGLTLSLPPAASPAAEVEPFSVGPAEAIDIDDLLADIQALESLLDV